MSGEMILNAVVTIVVALGGGSGLLVALLRKGHVTSEQVAKASEVNVDALTIALSVQKRVEKLEAENALLAEETRTQASVLTRVVEGLSKRPPDPPETLLMIISEHLPHIFTFGKDKT